MAEKRLYHTVADQIEQLIDQGVFPPKSRLPGERELAERFGVSRVTVREAEISLQAIGRIEVKTGSGVYVCERPSASIVGTLNVSAFELTEARALYEAESAALAAPIISTDDIDKLNGLLDIMSKPEVSRREADQADQDFHMTIARATGNAAISFVVESLWKMRTDVPEVRHVYNAVCQAGNAERGREHRDILDALIARDPVAARLAMRQHFVRLLESMLSATEQQAVEEVRRKATASRERFLISSRIG